MAETSKIYELETKTEVRDGQEITTLSAMCEGTRIKVGGTGVINNRQYLLNEDGTLTFVSYMGMTTDEANRRIGKVVSVLKNSYWEMLDDLAELRLSISMTKKGYTYNGVTYKTEKRLFMDLFGFSKSTYYNLVKVIDNCWDVESGHVPDRIKDQGLRETLRMIGTKNNGGDQKKSEIEEQAPEQSTENTDKTAKQEQSTENTDKGAEKEKEVCTIRTLIFDNPLDLLASLKSKAPGTKAQWDLKQGQYLEVLVKGQEE